MAAYDVWWKFTVEAVNDLEAERIAKSILCNPKTRSIVGNVVPHGAHTPMPPAATEIDHPAPPRLVKPTPDMVDGSSRELLLRLFGGAYWSTNAAVEAVEKCAPCLRDYYVQGPSAHGEAERQHKARVMLLSTVRRELAQIWRSLYEKSAKTD